MEHRAHSIRLIPATIAYQCYECGITVAVDVEPDRDGRMLVLFQSLATTHLGETTKAVRLYWPTSVLRTMFSVACEDGDLVPSALEAAGWKLVDRLGAHLFFTHTPLE